MFYLYLNKNKFTGNIILHRLLEDKKAMVMKFDKRFIEKSDLILVNVLKLKDIPENLPPEKTVIFCEEFSKEEKFIKYKIFYFYSKERFLEDYFCKEDLKINLPVEIFDFHLVSPYKLIFLEGGNKWLKTTTFRKVEDFPDFFEISRRGVTHEISKKSEFIDFKKSDCLSEKNPLVHIYIPTYYRLEKFKKSLTGITKMADESRYRVKIFIGDNNTKNLEMKSYLKSLKKDVYLHNENIGKSGMVNLLYKKNSHQNPTYIFSIDSDMYPVEGYNLIDRMIETLESEFNVGLVSANQKGECHHWFGRTIKTSNGRKSRLGESRTEIGIAGGCICLRRKDWEKIGMYREGYHLYAADDAILIDNVEKILGKRAVISIDYSIFHPSKDEDDKGYTEWKKNSFEKNGLCFEKNSGEKTKGFYD